jgi:hypothetical protein
MKRITRFALFLALSVLVSSAIVGLSSTDGLCESFGLHEIVFLGASYDAGTNSTAFTYQATAAAGYGFDCWVIALDPECFGEGHVIDASEAWEYVDPYLDTGITGLKFTQPYAPGESRVVWFIIKGQIQVGKVSVALTAECSHWFREMDGPICGPTVPAPECDATGASVCVGFDATLTDNTTGGATPYSWEWTKPPDATILSTANTLTITGVTLADAGQYRVIVTDNNGSKDTCYADLTVWEAPVCDVTPASQSVYLGQDATFTDNTTGGTPPYSWEWTKPPDATVLSTTNVLTITGVTLADAGQYRVIVTDYYGCEDTCYADLTVSGEGEGKSPGYWGNQLAVYLGLKKGKLKEPNVAAYAAQHGYTAQEAYDIMLVGEGGTPVEKLHRQLVAAKLSAAAGYLTGVDEYLEDGQYMVAHPGEFTEQEILDAKDFFESLHD